MLVRRAPLNRRLRAAFAGDEAELRRALETWLSTVVGDTLDGLVVDVRREPQVAGVAWQLDTQAAYPFEVTLTPHVIELRYGDASALRAFAATPSG